MPSPQLFSNINKSILSRVAEAENLMMVPTLFLNMVLASGQINSSHIEFNYHF